MTEPRTRSYDALNPVDQFPGVVRRTLVSGDRITFVEIRIAPGPAVPEHAPPHEHVAHVASGRAHLRTAALHPERGLPDQPDAVLEYVAEAHLAVEVVTLVCRDTHFDRSCPRTGVDQGLTSRLDHHVPDGGVVPEPHEGRHTRSQHQHGVAHEAGVSGESVRYRSSSARRTPPPPRCSPADMSRSGVFILEIISWVLGEDTVRI